ISEKVAGGPFSTKNSTELFPSRTASADPAAPPRENAHPTETGVTSVSAQQSSMLTLSNETSSGTTGVIITKEQQEQGGQRQQHDLDEDDGWNWSDDDEDALVAQDNMKTLSSASGTNKSKDNVSVPAVLQQEEEVDGGGEIQASAALFPQDKDDVSAAVEKVMDVEQQVDLSFKRTRVADDAFVWEDEDESGLPPTTSPVISPRVGVEEQLRQQEQSSRVEQQQQQQHQQQGRACATRDELAGPALSSSRIPPANEEKTKPAHEEVDDDEMSWLDQGDSVEFHPAHQHAQPKQDVEQQKMNQALDSFAKSSVVVDETLHVVAKIRTTSPKEKDAVLVEESVVKTISPKMLSSKEDGVTKSELSSCAGDDRDNFPGDSSRRIANVVGANPLLSGTVADLLALDDEEEDLPWEQETEMQKEQFSQQDVSSGTGTKKATSNAAVLQDASFAFPSPAASSGFDFDDDVGAILAGAGMEDPEPLSLSIDAGPLPWEMDDIEDPSPSSPPAAAVAKQASPSPIVPISGVTSG
ncbi:unnamed protein product, partial [Amoebophrya sp. A25]